MSNIIDHPPQPGEVWTADDDEVRLHVDQRERKGPRPVAILMPTGRDISQLGVANVAPLSATAHPDAITIPITAGYEETAPGYKPDPNSCAVLLFYQPIEIRFFCKYRGRLDEITQVMLKAAMQTNIIGLPEFDFDP